MKTLLCMAAAIVKSNAISPVSFRATEKKQITAKRIITVLKILLHLQMTDIYYIIFIMYI